MLDEAVNALGEHAFEVALPGAAPRVRGHHARHGRVRAQERAELRRRLELRGEHGLEHGEEEVLLAALVLVPVEREHDGLEERVDLGEADEAA